MAKLEVLKNRWLRWGTVSNFNGKPHFHRLPLVFFASNRNMPSLYLHHFVGPDDARDPHDHPKWFICIGLWGSYTERVYREGEFVEQRTYRAPFVRRFEAEFTHQIVDTNNAWTLVITGPVTRKWGFWKSTGEFSEARPYLAELTEQLNKTAN